MTRADMLARAADRRDPWDVVVVGGGATGAGVAVDAAARGYSVLLVERADFGSGTSSRSTKLVHGGVRYLRQGNLGLVRDALRERGRLRRNAPHLVRDLRFVLPCYRRFDLLKYGAGLTAYDLLAGRERFGRSQLLSARRVTRLLPTVRSAKLRGGVLYHDGQFDDARLLVSLVRTAADRGAVVLNHAPVTALLKHEGRVNGVVFHDAETGAEVRAAARVVVNAAGPFCDEVRQLADPAAAPLVAASQGSHVVLPRSFLPTDHALLIPETPDGRVLFAIPWHGHTLVGTTDVPIPRAPADPTATDAEIDFILETAGRYLATAPTRADVLATFAGVRPLVKGGAVRTSGLSRDHLIRTEQPGLVTITGGKWTTYRAMAEDCVDVAARLADLPHRPCPTAELRLHGAADVDPGDEFGGYGSDAAAVRAVVESDAALAERLHPDLPYRAGEVLWAARHELARTADDVLFRRLRAGALNTAATAAVRPRVEALLRGERAAGF
jgi:glycerol-3-phosphate dehydrogenase